MRAAALTMRGYRLIGRDAAAALDLLHVRADVRGAVEGNGEVSVWLAGELPPLDFAELRVEVLPADDGRTITGFERDAPILVAGDLLVRPPWVARPPGFAGVELVVPRGMAFGSGEHGSTQAALLAMHRAWNAPASLLDVGTGSGILARYAQVRGCPRVTACDIDPIAVAAAAELLPGAVVVVGGPEAIPVPADFVVANMTATELLLAFDALLLAWTRRAALVLSGMRAHEVDAVRARLPRGSRADLAVTVGDFTAFAVRVGT